MLPRGPDHLEQELLRRRIVIVGGCLDDEAAMGAATRLVALDAAGAGPIDLHLSSETGTVDAAFALVDAMAALRSPVQVTCVGGVHGAALAVVATAAHRRAAAHATFRLALPSDGASGTASQLAQWLAHHEDRIRQLIRVVAQRAGLPFEHVEADFHHGRFLTAAEALGYGLVDALMTNGRDRGP